MFLSYENVGGPWPPLGPPRTATARTTSIVFDLMQCFASDSHDTVVVMFRCV